MSRDLREQGTLLVWAGMIGLGLAVVVSGSTAWQWGLGIAVMSTITLALGAALHGAGDDEFEDSRDNWRPYCEVHGFSKCPVRTEDCPEQREKFL